MNYDSRTMPLARNSMRASLAHIESAQLARRLADAEPTYIFKHALVQDSAYTTLTRHERKRLHRLVAETLERVEPHAVDENAARLAFHFESAEEFSQAIVYYRRAATRAVSLYAYEEAIQHLQRARRLLGAEGAWESQLLLLEQEADVCRLLREGRRALGLYQEALNVWGAAADADLMLAIRLHRKIVETVAEVKFNVDLAEYQATAQARAASRAMLGEQFQMIEREPPHRETVGLLIALATDAGRTQIPSDWNLAQQYARAAVEMAEALDEPMLLSRALGVLADGLDSLGQLRENLAVATRRFELIHDPRVDDARERLDARCGLGQAQLYVGAYRQALPAFQEAHAFAAQIHSTDQQFNTLALLTQCYLRLDQWDEALHVETELRAFAKQHGRERTGPT